MSELVYIDTVLSSHSVPHFEIENASLICNCYVDC